MGEQRERGGGPARARVPRRWIRRAILGNVILVAAFLAVAVTVLVRPAPRLQPPGCAETAATAPAELAVAVCGVEYGRTGLPDTGARLAAALLRSGDLAAAAGLARDLLDTGARADALRVLGQLALAERRLDDAARALEEARRLHRAQRRRGAVAEDALALAELWIQRGGRAEALRSLDECVAEARGEAAVATEGRCHLAAARVLADAGDLAGAQRELDEAGARLPAERDRAWLLYEQGKLDRATVRGRGRTRHDELAVTRLEPALELARRARLRELELALHLELADSLVELGRIDGAERHLAAATVQELDGRHAPRRARLAARIAHRRGDVAGAAALNERAWPRLPAGDDRIAVAVMQARIALARGDLPGAERWARLGADEADEARAGRAVAELRPWVRAARREPLELLFAVLARAGRVEDAIAALDRWQGRALLDAMARPAAEPGLPAAASKLAGLERWLPAAAGAPLLDPGGRGVASGRGAAALRAVDLVGLAAADGDVWRLTASRGRIRLERIGALDEIAELADRFAAAPADPALAGALGARLLPDDVVRATGQPLHVVLGEPLAGLPVEALRRDGRPLAAARPVVRLLRLPAGACAGGAAAAGGTAASAGATVIGDAADDLPGARREADRIASLLGTTSRTGAAATSAALFAAGGDRVLHLAVHGELGAGGGALRLRDRTVPALEIAAARLGPPLVVVSASDPARRADPELAGSLAAAFLAGGSSHVVAALHRGAAPDARELADRFYAAGAAGDPVGALVRIQAELAAGGSEGWSGLAVFGRDACAAARPEAGGSSRSR
jgi:tetratricopeptide (TPR) repeat protein